MNHPPSEPDHPARIQGVLRVEPALDRAHHLERHRRLVLLELADLQRADAVLVIGSSLMVYSGYRFAHAASKVGKPIAAVNLGRTRADELLALKVNQPCVSALAFLLDGPSS